jgi:predicted phage terminase large subunit-like protein
VKSPSAIASLLLPGPPPPTPRGPSSSVPPFSAWLPAVSPEFRWDFAHLDLIRDHLADVTLGACKKLILSTPPQHGKSEHLTVRYPVWRLEREPGLRVAVGAYNQTHANRFSRKSRKLARTRLALSAERRAVNEWETAGGGSYVAVGVGAGITGLPVDLLVIDDPVKNREEADSPAHQERVYEWYMDDLTTRLQDGAPVVLVMTRWNDADLAGKILSSADGPDWRYVRLPALAEEGDLLGRPPGAPLCPGLHSLEDLEGKRRVMGEGFEGLYQQNPVPRGGLFFRREWFKDVVRPEHVPWAKLKSVRYWDFAGTKKDTSCYTAGVLLGREGHDGAFWVLDVVRGRWTPSERNVVVEATAEADRLVHGFRKTYFEQEPGSAGVEVAELLVRRLAGNRVEPDRATGKKETRAEPFADQARAGNVKLVAAPWTAAYLNELCAFPRGQFCDQVDSTSGAFNKLAAKGTGGTAATGTPAQRVTGDVMNARF